MSRQRTEHIQRSKTPDGREAKRERIRRRKRRRLILKIRIVCSLVAVLMILLAVWKLVPVFSGDILPKELEAPVVRSEEEVIDKLEEYAQKNKDYRKILDASSDYPEVLLAALANNPEMLDYVKGYPDRAGKAVGELTKSEKKDARPLFLQWDARWGYAPYGGSMIGISGCGPTCLAMVVHILDQESELTPAQTASRAEADGYYVEGTGTSWELMTAGAAEYGIAGTELPLDETRMKQSLDDGHPIICAMGPGDFTTAGHFIVIYGYDKKGFQVNDPNSSIRSSKAWTYEDLRGQIKNLWYYE